MKTPDNRLWNYTEDNHLRHGYQKTVDGAGIQSQITMIGECKRKPLSAFEESKLAAQKIFAEFGNCEGGLVLLLSGGADSEAMAEAFIAAKIPFRAVIGIYNTDLNLPDYQTALSFCEENQIAVERIEIDVIEFFDSKKHLEYGAKYKCQSPLFAVHIELLSRIRGVPVMAWNPTEVEMHPTLRMPDVLLQSDPHFSCQKYLAAEGKPGVPFFFSYTPELIHAFWRTPTFKRELAAIHRAAKRERSIFRKWMKWEPQSHFSTYEGKMAKYTEGGFRVKPRDQKRTGFEDIKIYYRDRFLKEGLIDKDFPAEPFNYFFRRPLEEMNPYPVRYIRAIPPKYFPLPGILRYWQKKEAKASR